MKKLIEGKELKSVILNTLLRFDEFCKERDIKYTIAYGTALGAIRHKGFIPWDDDRTGRHCGVRFLTDPGQ